MTRGMNMRDMKARSLGRQPLRRETLIVPPRHRPSETRIGPPDEDETAYDDMGAATLADQGDGMHVTVSPRPSQAPVDDSFDSDFPDEPPPGWGDG